MSEMKPKNEDRKVEWAFDFANISDSFNKLMESLSGEEELTVSEYSVARAGVESARVNVKFSVGQGFVNVLPTGSSDLFKATIHHVGELEFKDEGTTTKTVELKQKQKIELSTNPIKQGFRAIAHRDNLKWEVHLSPDVPLSLKIDGGVGPTKLDLTNLQLLNLKVDTGVGTLDLVLPSQSNKIEADIDGGVGQTKIVVPENADAIINVDGGVGAVEVTVPAGAAIQVKADSGIGAVHVLKTMKRVTPKEVLDNSGLWQSEGYDLATRRITVRYHGGVGEFRVREADVV